MGEVFAGRFELLEPIADGDMGSVWVVRDRRDQRLYAALLLDAARRASTHRPATAAVLRDRLHMLLG